MHPNPIFRQAETQQNLGFAHDRAFGILSVNGENGPLLAHVPFLLNDAGTSADLHLVRSNPIIRALSEPQKAVIAVSGPDSYISPDWYAMTDQVPTWNYVAVHLRGTLALLPEDDMRDMLDRQSAHFEDQLKPKTPWKTAKMTPEVRDRMMRQILPCRMTITAVDGTWKLGQNKPEEARHRAAAQLKSGHIGADTALLAALMLAPPKA
jgi:transcriptional regulator